MLADRGINTLDELNAEGHVSKETVMKMPTHHAIILATNDLGRVNLYKLISLSHLDYFHQRARIPKSEYLKHKEGLLIGSACEAGELYQAILQGRPQEEIIRLVKFYDYLEIQPLGNNAFMIKDEKAPISTMDELKDINRRIVKLGEEFHKPVVATCDVHLWTRRMRYTAGLFWLVKALRMPMSRLRYIFVPQKKCWRNSAI